MRSHLKLPTRLEVERGARGMARGGARGVAKKRASGEQIQSIGVHKGVRQLGAGTRPAATESRGDADEGPALGGRVFNAAAFAFKF